MFTRLHRWLASRKPQTIRTRSASAARRPLVETPEDRLAPAVLTVNTLADNNTAAADDFLSLREAIKIINSGSLAGAGHALTTKETAQIDETTALGSNDTIQFAPGLNGGTITLTADLLGISVANAKRLWSYSRARLFQQLADDSQLKNSENS